jgi:chromosome segregation ATPase
LEEKNTSLEKEKKKLEDDVATLTTEKDTLTAQNATLTTENTALVGEKAALTAQNATLTTENTALVGEKAALAAQNATLTTEKNTLTIKNTDLGGKYLKLELKNVSCEKEVISLKEEVSDFKIKKVRELEDQLDFIYKTLSDKIPDTVIKIKEFAAGKATFEFINNRLSYFLKEMKFTAVKGNSNKITTLEFKDSELNRIFDINESLDKIKVEVEKLKQNEAFIALNPFTDIDTFGADLFS